MRPPTLAVALRAGAFVAMATLTGASVAGCGSSDDTLGGTGREGGIGSDSTVPDAPSSDVGGDRADAGADEGVDDGGPEASDGGGSPAHTAQFPVKNVIFFVKENRTFDNYFGKFPGRTARPPASSAMAGRFPSPRCSIALPRTFRTRGRRRSLPITTAA